MTSWRMGLSLVLVLALASGPRGQTSTILQEANGTLGIGTPAVPNAEVSIGGTHSGAQETKALAIDGILTPPANTNAQGLVVQPRMATAASGNHLILSSVTAWAPKIIQGGATYSQVTTVYIVDAPVIGGTVQNYSLFNESPTHSRFRADVDFDGQIQARIIGVNGLFAQQTVNAVYGPEVQIPLMLGNWFRITATDGQPFTINTPGSANRGPRITLTIRNASGGPLGSVTFAAVYKLGAGWTSPANGFSRSIDFAYDGTHWIEVGRTVADVSN